MALKDVALKTGVTSENTVVPVSQSNQRWTPFVRQLGGPAKVDLVCLYAASFSLIDSLPYASPGVAPSRAECGRSAD